MYLTLQHKEAGLTRRVYVDGDPIKRSLSRLKHKLMDNLSLFQAMATLTYRDPLPLTNGVMDISRDLRTVFNKLRRRAQLRGESAPAYAWRVELGEQNGRPHVHVVLDREWPIAELYAVWPWGHIHIQRIKDHDMAAKYVSKYIGKCTSPQIYEYTTRIWGTSRGWTKAEKRWTTDDQIQINTYRELIEAERSDWEEVGEAYLQAYGRWDWEVDAEARRRVDIPKAEIRPAPVYDHTRDPDIVRAERRVPIATTQRDMRDVVRARATGVVTVVEHKVKLEFEEIAERAAKQGENRYWVIKTAYASPLNWLVERKEEPIASGPLARGEGKRLRPPRPRWSPLPRRLRSKYISTDFYITEQEEEELRKV